MEDLNDEEDGMQLLTLKGGVLDMNDSQYHTHFHIRAQSMSLENPVFLDSTSADLITPHYR